MRVTLHLTHRCNLNCTYCYADCVDSRDGLAGDMTPAIARRAVDLGATHIVFFGGEPTLRLDLIEEAAAHARPGTTFEITTNGTNVTPRFLNLVQRLEMTVQISVDGPEDVHDHQRKTYSGGGSFAQVDANLDVLLREIPNAIASATVIPQTAMHLSRSMRFLLDRGFRIVTVSPDHTQPWTDVDALVLTAELERMADDYVQARKQGRRFYLAPIDSPLRTLVHELQGCGAGSDHVSVGPDGTLYPCVQFVGHPDHALGHVDDGFEPVRLPDASTPECGDCALQPRCASSCACANFAATRALEHVSPVQCHIQRTVIPLADNAALRLLNGETHEGKTRS